MIHGQSKMKRRAQLTIVTVVFGVFAVGCELALDFDRTKIDGGAIDASFGDVATSDQVAPPGDGNAETSTDGGPETGTDAGTDTGADAAKDTGSDTGDAGNDAQDAADAEDSG